MELLYANYNGHATTGNIFSRPLSCISLLLNIFSSTISTLKILIVERNKSEVAQLRTGSFYRESRRHHPSSLSSLFPTLLRQSPSHVYEPTLDEEINGHFVEP